VTTVVGVIAIIVAVAGVVVVGAMFLWAARKDGEEDLEIQKRLGRRRKTRL
jgi:type IV secretory pathway VirB2 component (pilin)